VAKEVVQGLVTPAGAQGNYGVALRADGTVDARATAEHRAAVRASRRGALPLFDTGGDIESHRAQCLAQTGLTPPVAPLWLAAGPPATPARM
jgi:N-methylhydantoinase B